MTFLRRAFAWCFNPVVAENRPSGHLLKVIVVDKGLPSYELWLRPQQTVETVQISKLATPLQQGTLRFNSNPTPVDALKSYQYQHSKWYEFMPNNPSQDDHADGNYLEFSQGLKLLNYGQRTMTSLASSLNSSRILYKNCECRK